MFKRVISVFVAVSMLLSVMLLSGCASGDTYKVGVSIYQFNDNFMTLYRNGSKPISRP